MCFISDLIVLYIDKTLVAGGNSDYKTAIRRYRPGAGLGSTQPRMEHVIGCVDRRLTLPGYIGGKKIRDTVFAQNYY